ncbi:LapA family protein [Streptomyces cyaneofuscatus]|uniref:LapA family protein n=1 Tax=Streptomyces cyaneofuscatus TaxID=66883 RepID=UPI0036623959
MSPKDVTSDGRRGAGLWTPGRIAVAVLVVLAIVFICVNTQKVTIRVLIPEVTMPLWLALLAMFLIGLVSGGYLFRRKGK